MRPIGVYAADYGSVRIVGTRAGEVKERIEVLTATTRFFASSLLAGASFGTKFEGLAVSRNLPEQVTGLFHAGSVGIIMSGWLGAMNYGVIVANDVDAMLMQSAPSPSSIATLH